MLLFLYDETGSPVAIQYRNDSWDEDEFFTFFFEKNLFGDVIAIYNEAGEKIGSYEYDAWGECYCSTTSGITALESTIVSTYNPFRYRGYFYDVETDLYYLQSRYYSPCWGRFINSDSVEVITATPGGLTDKNLFAYCDNNPIMRVDEDGEFWNFVIGGVVGAVVGGVVAALDGGDLADVIVGGLAGAASGVVAASGLGVIAQAGISAAINGGAELVNQTIDIVQGKEKKL